MRRKTKGRRPTFERLRESPPPLSRSAVVRRRRRQPTSIRANRSTSEAQETSYTAVHRGA
jgi:hypothetical protein